MNQMLPIIDIQLECVHCHHMMPFERGVSACTECGEPILAARYDVESLQAINWRDLVMSRESDMWRFRELLPLHDPAHIVTMSEGNTPLIRVKNLGAQLGLKKLYLKDERQGPTGSFKDRQASVAVSVMVEQGITEAVVASTGNVAIAYSAYAARAGIKLWVFVTSAVPEDKMREASLYGSEVIKVTGTYDETKVVAARFARSKGLYIDRGIKSVAAVESMKTVAFELAEQLEWRSPDWFIQAVSGGMGPIGVVKGFEEMRELGLVDKVPSIGLAQTAGCAPMVQAFKSGQAIATPVNHPQTLITTLATGNPGRAYQLLWENIEKYGGTMEACTDQEAFETMQLLAQTEGISVEPAAAVAFASLFKMVRSGAIKPNDLVVVNASGHTFPVEKHILGDHIAHPVDVTQARSSANVPEEGLLSAVEQVKAGIERVIIIDDSPDAARLVARIFQARGVPDVRVAEGGAEGIRLVHEMRPDLVVTDLMMPMVDGFQVINALKEDPELQDVPIIVLSAKELTPRERERLAGQISSFLQKGSFIDEEMFEEILEGLRKV
jgi:threonine synthase